MNLDLLWRILAYLFSLYLTSVFVFYPKTWDVWGLAYLVFVLPAAAVLFFLGYGRRSRSSFWKAYFWIFLAVPPLNALSWLLLFWRGELARPPSLMLLASSMVWLLQTLALYLYAYRQLDAMRLVGERRGFHSVREAPLAIWVAGPLLVLWGALLVVWHLVELFLGIVEPGWWARELLFYVWCGTLVAAGGLLLAKFRWGRPAVVGICLAGLALNLLGVAAPMSEIGSHFPLAGRERAGQYLVLYGVLLWFLLRREGTQVQRKGAAARGSSGGS